MPLRRYARSPVFGFGYRYGTSFAITAIRDGINAGTIRFQQFVSSEKDRLDVVAGRFYGDGSLWWVICAASSIGWSPQVPAGTIIKIPDLSDISAITG